MPLSFSQNDYAGIITVVGDVEYREALESLEKAFAQMRDADTPRVLLFDLSQSTANRDREELQLLAAFIHEHLPGASLAVVALNDLYFGIGRMFAAYAESYELETQVFRAMDAAVAWCKARAKRAH